MSVFMICLKKNFWTQQNLAVTKIWGALLLNVPHGCGPVHSLFQVRYESRLSDRFVVLKRPSFQLQKYGMPVSVSNTESNLSASTSTLHALPGSVIH